MADLKLIGAVAVKVRPDTSNFRRETQQGIDEQLGPQGERAGAKATVKVNADTTEAQVKVTKLEDEVDGKTLTLNVGLDWDSVEKAKAQIDRAIKSLDNAVITTTMDRPSLEKAKAELAKLEDKAQVEFKFIQDEAGYRSVLDKIQRIREQRDLATEWKFDLDEGSLADTEAKAKRAIASIESKKTVQIEYNNNYDSLGRAIEDVNKRLDDARKLSIETRLNATSLEAARAQLRALQKNATVDFKFVRDEAGYQSILDKIQRIREQKGLTTTWSFKTDAASLAETERKAKEALARIDANKTIDIKYANNYDGINYAIGEIDKRLQDLRVLKITTKLDEKSLEEEKAKLLAKLDNSSVTLKINEDKVAYETVLARIKTIQQAKMDKVITFETDDVSLAEARAKYEMLIRDAPVTIEYHDDKAGYEMVLARIAEIRRSKIVQTVELELDEESLLLKEQEMHRNIDDINNRNKVSLKIELERTSLLEAEHEAKKLKDKIDDMKGNLNVGLAGTLSVSARLSFLGRDRIVNYLAKVDARSIAVAEGMLKSIGGLNTLHSATSLMESLFTKFDTMSIKIGSVATAFGSLADVGVYALGAVAKTGEGVVQSLGLLAAAPALAMAAGSAFFVYTAAFDNFFDAFNKNAKVSGPALEALPPIARKTVESIRGLYMEIQKPIQEAFWDRMGTSLQDAITVLIPQFKTGLLSVTPAIADFTAGMLNSFTKIAKNDDLSTMFTNLKGFFVNLSGASEPFFDGFNKFALAGSSLLPQFGQWITDMATRFDKWATTAANSGQITDWIQHGVNSLHEMWAVAGDVIDIFKAITRAAGLAGQGGLAEFEQHLDNISQKMLSEPWQSKAANLFEGAREGAHGLNVGFGNLTTTIGNASLAFGNILNQLGQIGGQAMTDISDMLGSKNYQNGVQVELQGLLTMTQNLRPAFQDVGDIIGNMGKVAGSVFSNLGGVINQMVGLIDAVTAKLADNLAAIAPKFANTIGGAFRAAAPVVLAVADALNSVLGFLSGIPNSMIAVGVAFGAFLGLRALASKFFASFEGTSYFKNLQGQWLAQQAEAGNTVKSFKMVDGTLKEFTVPTEKFSPTKAVFGDLTQMAGQTTGSIKEMYKIAQQGEEGLSPLKAAARTTAEAGLGTLKTAAGGLLDALGGPWGLAMGAAAIGIGLFAQSQRDAQQHVDDLTASVDKQTGQLNAQGLESIAKSWTDIGKAGEAWANFTRGAKAANETAKDLGLNLGDVTKTIAEGGPKSDALVGNLKNLASAMGAVDDAQNSNSSGALAVTANWDDLKKKVNDAAGAFGLTSDELDKMGIHTADVQHLADNVENEAKQAALAKVVFDQLGQATGNTSVQAQEMASAMQHIGDMSQDAAGKIGDINKALDILKGGSLSAREADAAAQKTLQTSVQQAQALADELGKNKHLIDQTTGLIDITSNSGLQLQQLMQSSADGIKTSAMAAYQQAITGGKDAGTAWQEAKKILDGGPAALQQLADGAHVPVDALKKEWDGFFGNDWQMRMTLSANDQQFQAAMDAAKKAGVQFDQTAFEAFLKANSGPVQMTVDEATQWANNYANGVYKANLQGANQEALQSIADAVGAGDAFRRGDYVAAIQAADKTAPGLGQALAAIFSAKNGPGGDGYAAAIKAFMDQLSAYNTSKGLDGIAAKPRTANIGVNWTGTDVKMPAWMQAAQSANGSILNGLGQGMFGFNPALLRMFANGGVENHIAQIARPSASTVRVWAEPETGGEAYIPLAASKRDRSVAILQQVATQFGYALTNKASAFADGGIITQDRTGGGVNVHIGEYNQHTPDSADDVARAIMRRVKTQGYYAPMESF